MPLDDDQLLTSHRDQQSSSHVHAVETADLTKRFPRPRSFFTKPGTEARRGILAVDRVTLQLRQGEIFGLVGPNGAGKTTLVKMLTTLLVPTSGWARVADLDTVKDERQVRRIVGLITSNERSFYWRLTGRQNLAFFASLYGLSRRFAQRWIEELFDLVGLQAKANERFDGYSTGMKQRLALARGLLNRPRFLFMDEPTKGVDPIGTAKIIDIIRTRIVDVWKPTVLITSHNLVEIERLCDRIAFMHNGRIIGSGTMEELRRVVRAVDHYHLTVRSVTSQQLQEFARTATVLAPLSVTDRDGVLELEADFERGSDGFARMVRSVVMAGGELLSCTLTKESLEDVFQRLIGGEGACERSKAQEPS
jgi:ABC-2 type transport system ATP-binding protein